MDHRNEARAALAALTDAELEARATLAARHYLDLSARRSRVAELWTAYRDYLDCCYAARERGLPDFARRVEQRARRERAAERTGVQP